MSWFNQIKGQSLKSESATEILRTMHKFTNHIIFITVLVFLTNTIVFGQEINMGLTFSNPQELAGVPIASTPFSGYELPRKKDLSDKMPPVGNQGKQNSCVGWAVGYAIKSYQERIEENNVLAFGTQANLEAIFSPSFIYNQINNGTDGGCLFIDALNLVSQYGIVHWNEMPYNVDDYLSRPSKEQFRKAKKYKIDYWRQVNVKDIKEVKAQVNAGYPVMIGAMIDRSLVNQGMFWSAGPFIWRSHGGGQQGGHAMVVVGYDDDLNAFKVMNSWGQSWGNKGYFWIDYMFFTRCVREGFVMKDAINFDDESYAYERPKSVELIEKPASMMEPDMPMDEEAAPQHSSNATGTILFKTANVIHNVINKDEENTMAVKGTLRIPFGTGRKYQIVVRYFHLAGYDSNGDPIKGNPINSLTQQYMLPDGSSASATEMRDVSSDADKFIKWKAHLPYNSLSLPKGKMEHGSYVHSESKLIAEPTLFVDNFAVQTGELIPFWVRL